jgi:enamine deaminase RidA (YjgF/YER057c/UK114 family)
MKLKKQRSLIDKRKNLEIRTIRLKTKGIEHHFISINLHSDDDNEKIFVNLSEYILKHQAQIITQFRFGGCELKETEMPGYMKGLCNYEWVVTNILGNSPSSGKWYSTLFYAISGCSVIPVYLNGRIVGFYYESEDAEYCSLGDIAPSRINYTSAEQTRQVFKNLETALNTIGMNFTNVVRIWLYLDKLLNWYSEFNTVRTSFFSEHGVFNNIVPASTGIGAGNTHGSALVSNLLAIKPKNKNVTIRPIVSPLQCPAINYGSSFSRAVEVQFLDHRRLFISGTASIDLNGNSIYASDTSRQIENTMEVVNAIIESRSMSWQNAVGAIAYFKEIKDKSLFFDYCRKHSLTQLFVVPAQTDICRGDLLFEIEVDLIAPVNGDS